ncbi:MAG: alpha-E domain-containing protein [Gammaproteobacteria bacterium]|jgi:uncharacterized alpha-E superfamily protein
MLSRVAENVYWMARYIERAENTARLVSVNAFLLLDLPRGIAPGWEPLIAITGSGPAFKARHKDYDERAVVKFLLGDPDSPSSILNSLLMARENCRTVRDIVPSMAWEQLTELVLFARENVQAGLTKKGRHPYLKRIIDASHMLYGMLATTMLRDAGYQFLRVGRNLERADMTTRIVDVRTENLLPEETSELRPFETIQWMSVLKSLSAYHMYRRKMQVQVRRSEVLRFLFLDHDFPRSVLHCLDVVEEALGALEHDRDAPRALRSLARKVARTKVEQLSHSELHSFIDELQVGLTGVHARIASVYFPPVEEAAQQAQAQSS